MKTWSIILLSITLFSCAGTQYRNKITHDELLSHTSYLASERLAGRRTGSAGDSLSERFIRRELKKAGLTPLANNGFQKFEVPLSTEAGPANSLSFDGTRYTAGTDFVPLAMSSNDRVSAEVIFAGYGFRADNDSMKWNDFSGMDVKGKWIMLLRGYPESNNAASDYFSLSSDRTKVLTAKDNGAAGVLLVSGDNWDPSDNLDKPARGEGNAGIPVIQIKRFIANELLKASGINIKEAESRINSELKPLCVSTGVVLDGEAEIVTKNVNTANVAMMLPGKSLKNEYVIIGAHFDHLGMGGPGSGSRAVDTIAVHPGADDNASGVALMIELAEKLASEKNGFERSIIFVAFTGEEVGLYGSKHFVENMGFKPSDVNLMVNLDMVGRMKENNGLQVGGVGTAYGLRDSVTALNDTALLKISYTDEGFGPSDHSSFYGRDIPVLFITTGAHTDYHSPDDTFDKLNYSGMIRIGDLVYKIASRAANNQARLSFRQAGPGTRVQGTMRRRGVTLGIMPDIAGNVKNGLRADFVTPGKPAANGGMKKGDVIVAIDNKPVNNIEEYMFRLGQLKPGQMITVDVMRDGNREVLLIQL